MFYIFRLLLVLIQNGANLSIPATLMEAVPAAIDTNVTFPVIMLICHHASNHPDAWADAGKIAESKAIMDKYAKTLEVLCQCMSYKSLQTAFLMYLTLCCGSGIRGVKCSPHCPVHQTLFQQTINPRKLQHLCRMTVWQSMQGNGLLEDNVNTLKYPKTLKKYLIWKI